jgi:hypothetical protein
MLDALTAHRQWRDIGYTIPVSVNLPVPLLENPDLPDELEQTARQWEIPQATSILSCLKTRQPLRLRTTTWVQVD